VSTRRPVTARERVSVPRTAPAVPRPAPRPAPEVAASDQVAEVPAQPPQAQQPQQPARRVEEEFTSRVYDTDDLDIPAFLRRR
jgi:hypothetical protein